MLRLIAVFAVASALASPSVIADESAAPARAGLKVHVDPATGNVLDEAPRSAPASAQEAERVQPRERPDYNRTTMYTNERGTVLLNLNGQVRMYSIARVKPSGEIEQTCVTAGELADHVGHDHEHAQER